MTFYEKSEALSKLTLGQSTDYIDQYQPSLLQAVPRALNRAELAISPESIPFKGEDIWYGYELSWLNAKGKPIVAVAEFRFSCQSTHIVESKSFKLYLNSFNQTKFDSTEQVIHNLTADLSKTADGEVSVKLFPVDDCPNLQTTQTSFTCIDNLDIDVEHYSLSPSLLTDLQSADVANHDNQTVVETNIVSHLLKSNCLITHQPDWASIYISYKGAKLDHEKLLKYLISFRKHNEFHEQCVERIFCDLYSNASFEQLTVFARYTRRGGLDINPFRSSHLERGPETGRTIRQ